MTNSEPHNTIKILILGDCNVGKTALLNQYIKTTKFASECGSSSSNNEDKSFSQEKLNSSTLLDDYKPTIEGNIYKAKLSVNSKEYTLTMADMSGNNEDEIYPKLRKFYYTLEKDIDVVLICFSLVDITSYTNVSLKWLPEVKEFYKDSCILLVGTKLDLKNQFKKNRMLNKNLKTPEINEFERQFKSISNATIDSNKTDILEESFTSFPTPSATPSQVSSKTRKYQIKSLSFPRDRAVDKVYACPSTPPGLLIRCESESKDTAHRYLSSSFIKAHMCNDDENNTNIEDEITLIEKRDCIKLKNTINAIKYLECSFQDEFSIATVLNFAIITGANMTLQKQREFNNNNLVKDDSFVSFDCHIQNSFSTDMNKIRKIKNLYSKLFIIQDSDLSIDCDNKDHNKSIFITSKKSVRFEIEDDKVKQQKEKTRSFDFCFKFRCFTCSRSNTMDNIDQI